MWLTKFFDFLYLCLFRNLNYVKWNILIINFTWITFAARYFRSENITGTQGRRRTTPSAGACPPPSAAETTASNMSKLVARIPAMAKGKDSFRVRVESTTSVLCERLLFGFMKLSNQMIYSVSPVHLVDGIVIGIF